MKEIIFGMISGVVASMGMGRRSNFGFAFFAFFKGVTAYSAGN